MSTNKYWIPTSTSTIRQGIIYVGDKKQHKYIFDILSLETDELIASVANNSNAVKNARLISNSPNLLSICKELVAKLKSENCYFDCMVDAQELIDYIG